ncbi:MAG: dienelactone hydrolase family protein [Dehalococcoidia bacterium]
MDGLERVITEWSRERDGRSRLNRRQFLQRAALLAGGTLLGLTLACGADPTALPTPTTAASAPSLEPGMTVSPDDPRLEAGPIEFQGNNANLSGYLSRPKGDGPFPGVLVIHENRGLLPHFPDVSRRLALEGYAALALDLLSREGGTGTFADSDQSRDALRKISAEQFVGDMNAAVSHLQSLSFVRRERIGAMGFCFGGGMVWLLSVRNPEIRAAVPFYGPAPPLEEVPNISAPVLGIYGSEDNRINQGVPDLKAALEQSNKDHRFITYQGANHAFFNDTGRRYHPSSATQAWDETLSFFGQHLKG